MMKKMRNLIGGEHKWDKRYKEPITKIYPQPLNEEGKWVKGKYKGKSYNDNKIPDSYIKWVLTNWKGLAERHKRKLSEALLVKGNR